MARSIRAFGYQLSIQRNKPTKDQTATTALAPKLAGLPVIGPPPHAAQSIVEGDSPERVALLQQIQSVSWYHTIELPHNVVTPGAYDHRPALHLYGLPQDLAGQDVLDVAVYDGFWAFEFERRGAASVTAVDLANRSEWDIPPTQRDKFLTSGHEREMGAAFKIAHTALNSRVDRRELSVYKLSPEAIGRTFDFVFCGDLLIHLRDPNLALQKIYTVTKREAIFAEPFDPMLVTDNESYLATYLGAYNSDLVWWLPSPEVWLSMIRGAGFRKVEQVSMFRLDFPAGREGPWRAVYRALV